MLSVVEIQKKKKKSTAVDRIGCQFGLDEKAQIAQSREEEKKLYEYVPIELTHSNTR